MIEVVALGELLVDFAPLANPQYPAWQALPGGAPANVLVCLSSLGIKTSYIASVGADPLGNYLISQLQGFGVDTAAISQTKQASTTMAFVDLAADGERSFSFYRKPGADEFLSLNQAAKEQIAQAKIFHYGSFSLSNKRGQEASKEALKLAQETKTWLSYDPNYRKLVWPNEEQARKLMREYFTYAHSVKCSQEELEFIFEAPVEQAVDLAFASENLQLLLITLGKRGAQAYTKDFMLSHAGYTFPDTIDTTGAGDIFTGAILSQLLGELDEPESLELTRESVLAWLDFANLLAGLSTRKAGGMTSVPTQEEIAAFRKEC